MTSCPCLVVFTWIVIGAVINGNNRRSSLTGFLQGAFVGPLFVWLMLLDKPKWVAEVPLLCGTGQTRSPGLQTLPA